MERADRRSFLEGQLVPRLPRSYIRFYWLLLQLGLAFVAMPLGQAFVSAFFWSLPHSPVQVRRTWPRAS